MTEKRIDIAHIYIDENGFCRIDLDTSKKDNMDEELATQLCDSIVEVCQNKPRKFLTNTLKSSGYVSPEARAVIRHHPGMVMIRSAEAFVINSLANRIILSMYLKIDKPSNPTKVFKDIESAKKWLSSLVVI